MKSGTQNTQTLKMNSNTNSNKFQKYDENQLNEAKESMKLLQTKMGNNLGSSNLGGSLKNTNINCNNINFNNNLGNNNNNNNNNYRKPFKPNFENDNMHIQIDSNKNLPGTAGMNRINSKNHLAGVGPSSYKNPGNNRISNTSNTHRNYPENNQDNRTISNQKGKNIPPQNNNPMFNYEEADDDRPAFAKTNIQ
jgi:hypothetical protein